MDQYIDNRQKEIFWNLLANPADKDVSSLQSLERLVSDYPQSGVLQVLAARARGISVNRVAAYVEPKLLHKLINDPQNLPLVEADSITDLTNIPQNLTAGIALSAAPAIENVPLIDPYEAIREPEPEPLAYVEDEEDIAPVTEAQQNEVTVIDKKNEDAAEEVADLTIPVQRSGEPIDEEPIDEIAEAPQVFNLPEQAKETETTEQAAEYAARLEKPADEEETAENVTEEPAENKFFTEEVPAVQTPAITEEKQPEIPPVNEYRFSSRFPKHEAPVTPEPEHQKAAEPIEDEIYDEIVGIDDIGFKPVIDETKADTATEHRFSEPDAADTEHEEDRPQPEVQFHQPADAQAEPVQDYREVKNEEEKLILGGIVGGDYLSFDKKLDELRENSGYIAPKFTPQQAEQEPVAAEEDAPEALPPAAVNEQPGAAAQTADQSNVSRYDDDNMPYSFLWWLDKTRKEHAANLRPYAEVLPQAASDSNPNGLKRADELQQQYFENIVRQTSVNDVEHDTDSEHGASKPEKKEDVIIERFIQSDPQIKPLSADKLDNENKAKRSSEDTNEVVTETLARIYADQMLYHKAIATYKKLILKFPEKSTYFAARIEELEKKTN